MNHESLALLADGQDLTASHMEEVVTSMMQGQWSEQEMGTLLTTLRAKGETVDEVVGAARAIRRQMAAIHSPYQDFIDTCGTGGDGAGTFNISTAAALVTAAAGLPVAKHGNRSVSSKSGSSDVLAELGVNVSADLAVAEQCLAEIGICFCFAPLCHQAMKHVAPVRKQLGVPTIFNMLGPLSNPAGAPYQLLGVGRPELRPLMAEAIKRLGIRRAMVVHGSDGLDEMTLGGPTHATLVTTESTTELTYEPVDFGIGPTVGGSLSADSPQASAEIIRQVLAGQQGAPREIVVLNAAAALWVAQQRETPSACTELAIEAIDSGRAAQVLADLAAASHRTK